MMKFFDDVIKTYQYLPQIFASVQFSNFCLNPGFENLFWKCNPKQKNSLLGSYGM